MVIKVGTAPAAWGVNFPSDPKQIPWSRYLDEVTEAGYKWTELGPYGYLPTNLKTLKAELNQRQLKLSSGFIMRELENPDIWPEIEQEVLNAGELIAALGAKFLVLIDGQYTDQITGEAITPDTLNSDVWKIMIDTTHSIARLAKKNFGLRTLFHPHTETHVQYEPQIKLFMKDTDPGLVGLCFDIGHHSYLEGNVLSFLQTHHERIEYLHLKSVHPQKLKKVRKQNASFASATIQGVFCEPSYGTVDFLALLKLLEKINYSGFGVVEHDMYPAPFDKPLPIAKRTRAYLKKIGMG